MKNTLSNEAADDDAIVISVFVKYKPLEHVMVLYLVNHRFSQWHLSTSSGRNRDIIVPWPDKNPLPYLPVSYMESEWRPPDISFLEFLRKTTEAGTVNRLLRE